MTTLTVEDVRVLAWAAGLTIKDDEIGPLTERFNAIPAPRIDQTMIPVRGKDVWVMALMPSLTIPHNLTGAPALTVPCGFATSGLPVGLQIVGRPFEDATVLRVGHAYEQATDWHRRRPAI